MSLSALLSGGTLRRPPLFILVAITAVNPLAMNIFIPSMPGMTTVFSTTYSMVQLTLSVYLAAICVCQLIIGPLADRYGRRPIILIGFVIFVIGTLICLFSTSIEMLITGRLIQGAGGSVGIVLGRTIVRDLYDENRAASMIGYVTMGMAVAPLIGPAIGGFLDEYYNWQAPFELVLVASVLTLIGVILLLGETRPVHLSARSMAEIAHEWKDLFAYRRYWAYSGATTFTTAVFFAFLGSAPYVCHNLFHMSPSEYGLYFTLLPGGYMIGNFITGRFSERMGINWMILAGSILCLVALGMTIFLFSAGYFHPMALFGPLILTSVANGMVLPNATAGAIGIRPDLAGSASGLTGSLQIGGGMLAGALAGIGVEAYTSVWPMLVIMLIATVLGFFCGLWANMLTRLRN